MLPRVIQNQLLEWPRDLMQVHCPTQNVGAPLYVSAHRIQVCDTQRTRKVLVLELTGLSHGVAIPVLD
jgi:hypothetical protein